MSGDFIKRDNEDLSDLDDEFRPGLNEKRLPAKKNTPESPPKKYAPSPPRKMPESKKGKGGCFILLFIIVLLIGAAFTWIYLFHKDKLSVTNISILKNISLAKDSVITISVTPDDAAIFLDNTQLIPELTADGKRIVRTQSIGKHTFSFKKEGYRDVRRDVELVSGGNIIMEITLVKKFPKRIVFNSKMEDIRIFLDNNKITTEPDDQFNYTLKAEPGKHVIKVEKPGYKKWEKEFELPDDDGVDLGTAELTETGWKTIEIDVQPLESEVLIDGVKIEVQAKNGLLITEPVEPGKHKIEIQAAGYKTWTDESAEIFGDLTNSIGPIVLEPIVKEKPKQPPPDQKTVKKNDAKK